MTSQSRTIGVVPIDAIFSPVRRVTFDRSSPPASSSRRTTTACVLDIETDGSITPKRGAGLGRGHPALAGRPRRQPVAMIRRASSSARSPPSAPASPDLDLPIEDLDLSERPRNCLKRAQINTIGELLTKTEDDLLNITNFGQKSLDEVKAEARRARPDAARS